MFGLFSAGLASDLTVVVKAGGTQGSGTSKVIKVSQHISERVHELEFLLISYFSVDLSKLHGLIFFYPVAFSRLSVSRFCAKTHAQCLPCTQTFVVFTVPFAQLNYFYKV